LYGSLRNIQLATGSLGSFLSRLPFQTRIQTDVTQPGIFRFIIAPRSGTICLCSWLNNKVLAFKNDRSGNWFRTFMVSACTVISRPYRSMTTCSATCVFSFLPTDIFLWCSCTLEVLLLIGNDLLLVRGTFLSARCEELPFCLIPKSWSVFFFHSTVQGPGNGSIILDVWDDFCCLKLLVNCSDKFCGFTDWLLDSCTIASDGSVSIKKLIIKYN